MEKQTIVITLEEYKALRDMLEDYKLMCYIYQQLTCQPEEVKVKKKNPIGFQTSKDG